MDENEERLAISVKLDARAYEVFAKGTIQPLFLATIARAVPMIVAGTDSPARADGKDAMFQLCCETCARSLQKVLKDELGPK